MNVVYNYCDTCRICKSPELFDIINLGEQIITSRFPVYGDFSTPKTPIVLCLCSECSLVQLRHSTSCSELYEHEYGYRSGISNTMREHLKLYKEEIESKVNLNSGDIIVDIGSNDSTMLQYYDKSLKRIGVDPTGIQFKEFYGDVELVENYFTFENVRNKYGNIKCKVISSISMFYDLPDPVQFAKDIHALLDDDGIWTCEQSYLLTMLRRNSIDTICHEHLEYYSLTAIKRIADMSNFNIIDVKFNECNGGSFRIYFAKKSSTYHNENTELVTKILNEEKSYGIKQVETYFNFIKSCDYEVEKLDRLIQSINKNGKKMYIYGASTKGNCLLQYANIGNNKISYAVERNPRKFGKMTVTGVQIIGEEQMRENPPQYLLVLPWHFRDEIIKREDVFLENGGQLVFPFPTLEIYSKKPKMLITGCDGMIGKYVLDEFKNDYNIYGLSQNDKNTYNKEITRFYFDINDCMTLEKLILSINPYIIVHLSGISNSGYAFNNVIETLHTNGLATAHLCDIIEKNNLSTKLFNASSSEIYKGHVKYNVSEDDTNMFHLHPYSIGKILSHNTVKFYRSVKKMPFSNGVLFTIESKLKADTFLINKVAKHIKQWNKSKTPLTLGQLDSYRSILHASDAARAIRKIIEQENGDDYIICNYGSYKVIDLVTKLFQIEGINIIKEENIIYEAETHSPIIIIKDFNIGFDTQATDITGTPFKLERLGWKPQVTVDEILGEILNK